MAQLAILGSTGSIGRNTLQVVREMRDEVDVVSLAAGKNVEELVRQTLEFRPKLVSLADEATLDLFREQFSEQVGSTDDHPELVCGAAGNLATVQSVSCDVVVSAAVGVAGS